MYPFVLKNNWNNLKEKLLLYPLEDIKGSILRKFQVSIPNTPGIIPIPIFGDLNRGETGIEGDLKINILKIFNLVSCHGKYPFAFRLNSKCLDKHSNSASFSEL